MKSKRKTMVPQFSFRPRSIVDEKLVMNRNENAVFDIILSIINDEDDSDESIADNTNYMLYAPAYSGYMGVNSDKDAYKALRSGMKSLYEHDVVIGDDKVGMHMRIISKWAWNVSQRAILFELTKDIKQMLIAEKRKNCNTFYIWKYSLPLSGKYAPKLYYCLKEWAKTGNRIDTVENLRYILNFPENDKYCDIHRKIVSSIEEINEKTDIFVSFDEIKENVRGGSKVVSIRFNIQNKKNIPVYESFSDVPGISYKAGTECIIKGLIADIGIKVSEKDIQSIAKKADDNHLDETTIRRRLNSVKDKMFNKKNPVGFLIFVMSDQFSEIPEENTNTKAFSAKNNSFKNFHERGENLDKNTETRYWELFTKKMTYNNTITEAELQELEEIECMRN